MWTVNELRSRLIGLAFEAMILQQWAAENRGKAKQVGYDLELILWEAREIRQATIAYD